MFWVILLMAQAAAPSQIERGEALFMAPDGCGTCHALKGKGTAVGPDLRGIARLGPSGIATAVRSTVTQYVQIVKLKSGESFPAMPPSGDAKVKLYDLSKTPPELHEVDKADIASMTPNNGWKHPPSVKKLSNQQMADIVAYIRYAGANIRQPVDPAGVQ